MKRYFPFLRGKQNELMAVRDLAQTIAERGNVIPIIEPVNSNATTRISVDRCIEVSMPFLFICNPFNGAFEQDFERLYGEIIEEVLMEYDNWTPAFQVQRDTSRDALASFMDRYREYELAAIYYGLPTNRAVLELLGGNSFMHHILLAGRVEAEYINGIAEGQRVMMSDRFNRQARNADYPEREFFTDMNTVTGNPRRLDFGDFSIVGNNYSDTGGPAYAVSLHHIHFQEGPGPLYISHFISDRTDTTADTPGKIMEALDKLVEALDDLLPNDTEACDEYREMADDRVSRGLGYMKRLAIKHHLELMLNGGIRL